MFRPILSALLLLPILLRAQQPPARDAEAVGTIRGTVYDSLGQRALAGATVELTSPARVAVTDQRGNFTMDSVPVGARRLTFAAPELDSIGLFGFARDLEVVAGVQRVALATPSFGTMYRTLCAPSSEAAKDSAIMFGTVYDARTRLPVPAATVWFSWYAVDETSGPQLMELVRQSATDDAGNYGRCGLPADLALRTHARSAASASGPVATVIGEARVYRRDFFVSDEFGVDTAPPASRGSGIVLGTVRDDRGGPLVNALVVLTASDRTARTDSLGQYRLVGVPLGTQELSVRQVGLGALYRTIDVTADAPLEVSFTMPLATVLATVNVRGERRPGVDRAGYLSRQQMGWGRYLNQQELAKRPDMQSALSRVAGLLVRQTPGGLSITNARNGCDPLIVIDGVPGPNLRRTSTIPIPGQSSVSLATSMEMRIESMNVRDVVAVEYYAGSAGIPLQYTNGDAPRCGMLLIWTLFARW